jgi:uncharacterized heparinase superfamily protein
MGQAFGRRRPALLNRWLSSMWRQSLHLHANLEWDLRANHLLRDATGLAWVGRFFSGHEADRWMRTATELAFQQADEQMLADGGHFERSPFYHLEVMDDWLSLALLLRDEAARKRMRQTWQRAAEYARWLRHPDGRIPQFNDGAAVSPEEHLRHGAAIGVYPDLSHQRGGRYFADSGVVVWHGQPWSVFLDVGEIGPDYQPGHAHADSLTVECSLGTDRLFIDPGTYAYDSDESRRYDRSTSAHNTVCVDGIDSSEVWSVFRVGRRARIAGQKVQISADRLAAFAGHNGYKHLSGSPYHQRRLEVANDGALVIRDEVLGSGKHTVEGGYLLAPGWRAAARPNGWQLDGADRLQVKIITNSTHELSLAREQRLAHPNYGIEVPCTRLSWRLDGCLPMVVKTVVDRL